ncbi:MAG: hypothetical protein HOG19_15380 [Gammaproteobacteria bacterium]|nr:hypothetical protein [Gammaproteobacteria bacterium]
MKKQTGIRKEPYIGSFSSFSEKHTEQVTSVISQLRNPASAAVVTSENYALQEHYVREIVSNVFTEKENGEVKRAPLNRDSIIKKVNVRLQEIAQFDLQAKGQGVTQELWIFELTNSESVSSLSLVHRILSQFKQAGISVLILTTGIAWRSEEMKRWLRVTRTPLWSFDLPDAEQCADFVLRAERDGSLQTARELVHKLAVQEDIQDDLAQIVTFDPLALADKIQADKSADQVKNENVSKESVDKAKTRSVMQKKSTFVGVAALMFLGITFPAAVLFDDVIRESIESASIRVEAFFNDQAMNTSAELVADTIEIKALNNETTMVLAPQEELILDETVLGAIEVIAPVEAIIPEKRAPELVANAEVLPLLSVPELSVPELSVPELWVPEVKVEEKIVEAKYFLQEAAFLNKNAAVAWIAKRDALEQFRVELKKNNYWAVVRGPYGEAELGRMRSNGGFENTYMISESDLLN